MPSSKTAKDFSDLQKALSALEALRIPFRGPLITKGGHHIYVVAGCLLTEAEIVELHSRCKFDADSMVEVLSEIWVSQTANKGVDL
jgi:hypothetical protein